jgi:putative thioredoxin
MADSPQEKSPWIIDVDDATFQREAVERSRQVLVIVDFWAAWCQPCRLLGPILEKLARDYSGKFVLARAEMEKLPAIAAGFGVEAIPAVYALRDGGLVDFFVGLRDERQLRAWIERLLPSEAESLVAEGRALEATDANAAEAKLKKAAELDPNLASARIGLAGLYLSAGRADESRAIIDELEKRGFLEEEAEKLKAQLHVRAGQHAPADLAALRATASADPKNFAAALQLARALAAANQYEEALETAIGIVQSGKKEFVDPARELMVDIFRLLPDGSPLATDYRRRLSTALY